MNILNKEVIVKVFDFYCKQQYVQGQHATFERQQYEASIFTVGKWMHFCKDFQIKAKNQRILELFKKYAKNQKELNYDQFIQLLNMLAIEEGQDQEQFIVSLGLDNWKLCQQKMKPFQKPFQMRDKDERIKEVKYEYKIFHPDVKDDEQIKQILLQRKEQNEYQKQIEREKKAFNKLQFELKHSTKSQLIEKYPNLIHLIERLPNPSKPTTCSYMNRSKIKSQHVLEQKKSGLTWESLNNLPIAQDFVRNLVDDEEDQFLQEYQLNSKQVSVNRYQPQIIQKIDREQRSFSDYNKIQPKINLSYDQIPKSQNQNNQQLIILNEKQGVKVKALLQNLDQSFQKQNITHNIEKHLDSLQVTKKKLLQQQQQQNYQNYSVEYIRDRKSSQVQNEFSFQKEKNYPIKINNQMSKRVQEIQDIQAVKEKNLLNSMLSYQRQKIRKQQKY
ncbi:unnamed protein product [Paramecium primaurelia]|uniref:Uncharacterized protein n=1 Tax=Paramecium primaurelia TaxID=5886 RepID=A0A8S1P1S8_PARPR|nr:unnamed protein product [Paramecium primaurelia]